MGTTDSGTTLTGAPPAVSALSVEAVGGSAMHSAGSSGGGAPSSVSASSGGGTATPLPMQAPLAVAQGASGSPAPLRPRARLGFIKARDLRLAGGARLGQGSFGDVQRAEWDGTPVAVKVNNNLNCRDTAAIDRERSM